MVENEIGCKVQTLRTDRGGEYMSGAFKDFLGKKGIKHQCTMPYTPQQNGVAERKNRSLIEMARCMLKAKSLPHKLWMEAVACATHVLNRCPTRALQTITPYESWYDRKPSVSYLRVFGCFAYAHIPQQLRGKLDDKAVKCTFVGYSSGSKGYRFYNPATNKIFESRDVIFAKTTAQPIVAFDVPHMQTQNVFEGFLPSFVENQESQQVNNFDQSFDQHVTPHDVEEIVREEQEVLREERTLPKWLQRKKLQGGLGLIELLEESPSEKLLDAIIQEGCDASCLSDAINNVNPYVDFCLLVENAKHYMLEEWESFEGCLQKEIILYDGKEFVHLTDFSTDPVTKGKTTRSLVPKPIAFLLYLGLLLDINKKIHNFFEPKPHPPFPLQSVSTIENLDKGEDLEVERIDLALEKKESANLDVALFRAQLIVDEPTEDIPILETSLTLVHLPYFHLNGKDYITLHSIQSLFNLREDYCFAVISEASQVAKNFLDIEGESKEEFLALDLETSNKKLLEAPNAFDLCLKRVDEEEPVLKDEDFEAKLVELGIDKFGRNIEEPNKVNFVMGKKINLEHED
ncbi:hypothetical protein L7F22_056726 [Adiantum nelumboides]|nr:hypothetical protein [Adiantum nelumboides]